MLRQAFSRVLFFTKPQPVSCELFLIFLTRFLNGSFQQQGVKVVRELDGRGTRASFTTSDTAPVNAYKEDCRQHGIEIADPGSSDSTNKVSHSSDELFPSRRRQRDPEEVGIVQAYFHECDLAAVNRPPVEANRPTQSAAGAE